MRRAAPRIRMMALIAAAPAWIAPGPASAADRLAVALEPGAESVYELSWRLELEQRGGTGGPARSAVEHRATIALKVEAVEADGTARLSGAFRALSIEYRDPPLEAMVSLPRAAPAKPAEEGGGAGDGAGAGDGTGMERLEAEAPPDGRAGAEADGVEAQTLLERLAAALFECTPSITVESSGMIRAVRGLEAFAGAVGEQEVFDARAAGVFTPRTFAAFIAPLFDADGGLGRPAIVGTAWDRADVPIALPPIGEARPTLRFRLVSIDDGAARIEGETALEFVPRPGRDPALAEATPGAARDTSVLLWDLSRGGLRSRERTQSIVTAWTLGEVRIEQTQECASRIRLVAE